jgi:hypothetical protein
MKKFLFLIPVILIITIVLFVILRGKTTSSTEVAEDIPTPTVALPTISDNIKIDLSAKQDNKIIVLNISGLTDDMESVEYELTYNTGAGLPRGVLGKILTKGEKNIFRDDIVLGTCSSGKCVYDSGVISVDLSLKFNSQNSTSVFRKTYNL